MSKNFWTGIGIVFIIAFLGVFYQKHVKNPHCAYDGSPIMPIYEVEIILKDKSKKKFCSVYCAVKWFENNKNNVDRVIVTDEIRGNKIDSYMAYYVKSELVTNKTNNNRIHVFQQRHAAIAHAEKFNGERIYDPFELEE